MALVKLANMAEIATAVAVHGTMGYVGTNLGNLYRVVLSTGVYTLIDGVNAKIVAITVADPKIYLSTTKGDIYSYTIDGTADKGAVISLAPGIYNAGLKIHTHLNVNNSGGATYDYTYINELKGEFVSTSGVMVGLGADYELRGTGTGSLTAISGYAKLYTGITLSGAAYPAIGTLIGGQFFVNVAGTLNGTGVLVAGLYAGVNACTGGTLTEARYMAGIWGDWKSTVDLGTGDSSILLLTNSASGTVDYGIQIVNGSTGAITNGIYISSCVAQAFRATVTAVAGAGSLTGSALCIYATGAAGQQDVGIVAYLDATAKGQSTANWTYGAGIWLNIDSTFLHAVDPAGWANHEQLCPLSVGVYAPTEVTTGIDDCDIIYGIKAELVGNTAAPTSNGCYFAALNVSQTAATKTAIFFAHQGAAVGQGATKSGAAGGSIALCCINGTMHYVNTFTS
jgi:hypothetical protein